jgi:hypothetical protein
MDVSTPVGVNMDGVQWQDLQDVLIWVFSPLALWWGAFYIAASFVAAAYTMFMWLFAWLTKSR